MVSEIWAVTSSPWVAGWQLSRAAMVTTQTAEAFPHRHSGDLFLPLAVD